VRIPIPRKPRIKSTPKASPIRRLHAEELFGHSRLCGTEQYRSSGFSSSSLLSSAYSKGYLETKDATKDNVITLRIISSDLHYNNASVQALYRSAMDNYLEEPEDLCGD
jgi:hypothetical protein